MHFFCGSLQINLIEECIVFRKMRCPAVFFFKDAGIYAFRGVAVSIVLPVSGNFINKKQRQHFDALRTEACFFVEVLADGAADHFALYCKRLHIAPCLARLQVLFAAGDTQLQELVAFLHSDFPDAAVCIYFAPGSLFQIVAVDHRYFLPLDACGGLHVEFNAG